MLKTRTIHDRFDPERRLADNNRTRILPCGEHRGMAELFVAHYPAIRAALRHALTPGVVLVSVDGQSGAVGYISLAAHRDHPVAAVVGRHGQADLRLPCDPRVALRHLAVVLPAAEARQTRQRVLVLDLNTGQGFEDERGVMQRAVLTDGSFFFRLGRYAVFMLDGELARRLPSSGEEAWQKLPRRIYEDHTPHPEPRMDSSSRHDVAPDASAPCVTHVSRIGAPRPAQQNLLEPGEQPLGELVVLARGGGREVIRLGAAAARRGVLVGRYRRCATSIIRDEAQSTVSRVHLLVIQPEWRAGREHERHLHRQGAGARGAAGTRRPSVRKKRGISGGSRTDGGG